MNEFLGMDIVEWVLQHIAVGGSILGLILCKKKNILCWKIWFVANFFWFALFVYSGLYISLIQPVVYNWLNWLCYEEWKKDLEVKK